MKNKGWNKAINPPKELGQCPHCGIVAQLVWQGRINYIAVCKHGVVPESGEPRIERWLDESEITYGRLPEDHR